MGPAIAIGANIHRHRKESHQTLDDLARHLGATKTSVSKWKTGQSYPDIELLPRIATYFDVTVDALMGYELQMSKEGIRRECARLREAFANKPFDEAHAQCEKLVHDCYKTQSWLENINAIGTSAPRDDAFVKRSLVESVAVNLAFEPLWDESRYTHIVESLREAAR